DLHEVQGVETAVLERDVSGEFGLREKGASFHLQALEARECGRVRKARTIESQVTDDSAVFEVHSAREQCVGETDGVSGLQIIESNGPMHIFEDHTARLQNTDYFQLFEIGPAFDQSLLQAKPSSDLHLREIGRTMENTFFDGQSVLKNALGKIDATFESAAHQPRV